MTTPTPSQPSLADALHKLQASPIVAKQSGRNPHFGSGYSTLEDCWEACRKPIQQAGLVVAQFQYNGIDGNSEIVTRVFHHKSPDDVIDSRVPLPKVDNMQKLGSAITYARRYGLVTALGILTGEDDDANAAAAVSPESSASPEPRTAANPELASSKQTGYLKGLLNDKDTSSVNPDWIATVAKKRDEKTMTKEEAKAAIDKLVNLPDKPSDPD